MAYKSFDISGNSPQGRVFGEIRRMLRELYLAAAAAVSGTTGTFTGLVTAQLLKVDTGTKTATASAGAATLAKYAGVVTSEALTTAAAAAYTLTITTTALGVAAADMVFASVANGTNTQGVPVVTTAVCGVNTVTIVVTNLHASQALNGTLKISYEVHKA